MKWSAGGCVNMHMHSPARVVQVQYRYVYRQAVWLRPLLRQYDAFRQSRAAKPKGPAMST